MKEIISFAVPKDLCEGCIVKKCKKMLKDKTQCYLNRKPYILVENKVPETWEELCELVDNLPTRAFESKHTGADYIGLVVQKKGMFFEKKGMKIRERRLLITKNRTPQQMWQIIKNLIGEER